MLISFLGDCTKLNVAYQDSTCDSDLQQCTLTCETGLVPTNNKTAVKLCQLDGNWSGPDIKCGMLSIWYFTYILIYNDLFMSPSKSKKILPTHVLFGNGISYRNIGLPSSNLQ